ncbi:MAG: hypothetical protein JNL72_06885 [Flavipsychrobacter sp.]|nr:hypothetical protein [Flavipsychrobacter sp.]
MKWIISLAIAATLLTSCGGNNTPSKTIPGAAGVHLYDMMDEDSTEQKTDTTKK